jgi:hypothetical protein
MSETLKKIDNYKKKELPTFFYSEFIIICNIQIGAGRRCTQRQSLTCCKSMTNLIIYG